MGQPARCTVLYIQLLQAGGGGWMCTTQNSKQEADERTALRGGAEGGPAADAADAGGPAPSPTSGDERRDSPLKQGSARHAQQPPPRGAHSCL
jgi:hypothetical protein